MTQPAYKKIQSYILRSINSGLFSANTQIPTELELCTQFNVSRMTVNKAISELSKSGILHRIAGKGTFVANRRNELPMIEAFDILEQIVIQGNKYSGRQLQLTSVSASPEVATQLGVSTGKAVAYCKMLHLENGFPLMLEERYVNQSIAPRFLDQHFGDDETPSSYLQRHYPVSEIEHSIEAVHADDEIAELLSIKADSSCLLLSRRTWTADTLISYVSMVTAGSRYKIRLRSKVN